MVLSSFIRYLSHKIPNLKVTLSLPCSWLLLLLSIYNLCPWLLSLPDGDTSSSEVHWIFEDVMSVFKTFLFFQMLSRWQFGDCASKLPSSTLGGIHELWKKLCHIMGRQREAPHSYCAEFNKQKLLSQTSHNSVVRVCNKERRQSFIKQKFIEHQFSFRNFAEDSSLRTYHVLNSSFKPLHVFLFHSHEYPAR